MALVTLLVALIVNLLPTLESVQGEIVVLISALILALVGDYTVRDAARIGQEHGQKSDDDEDKMWAETD